MLNIFKAINYQTSRDNFTVYAFLLSFLFLGISFMNEGLKENLNGGYLPVYLGGDGIFLIVMMFTLIMSTRICGWDHSDKTINYEILSGHCRRDVYFSRIASGLLWGIAGSMAICVLPVIAVTIFKGWGNNISMSGVAFRYLLLIFPIFRMTCEFMFVTFIIRSFAASIVASYIGSLGVVFFTTIMQETSKHELCFEFAMSNITKLFTFTSYMGFADGKDINMFDTDISSSVIIGTIAVSLAVGIILILAGYAIFAKRDME